MRDTATRWHGDKVIWQACWLLVAGAPVLGQTTAAIDMTGMLIKHNTPQSRNSSANPFPAGPAQTLTAAAGFSYSIDGMAKGTSGALQALFPNPTPLRDVLEYFAPGQSRLLKGYVRNEAGTLPVTIYAQTFSGTLGGIGNVTFRLTTRIDAAGIGYVEFSNISFPLGGLIVGQGQITSGTTTISRWVPTPPVQTEWHFGGNLSAVAGSGPALMRYLDDPAFGAPLRGTTPDPALPTGVTQAQSSFGTTSSFGIPAINGQAVTVYKTSPTRNLSDPTNPDKCRPIGLCVWPNTRTFFPDDKIGQWTMVYDILIPASSWGATIPAALLQDTDTNSDDADMFIRNESGTGRIGYGVTPGEYLSSALIQPNTWMRIAVVSDGYSSGTGRVFINGQFVGVTGGDWVYNSTDSNTPKFGDGTAVPPATWSAWGQFPSPWALSQGTSGVGMQSTFSIFSDDTGDGESVYIKNFYFTDRCMTDAQVIALGGVNAAGIVFTSTTPACYANCDGSTTAPILNVQDFSCFLNKFASSDTYANCDASTTAPVLNVQDFSCFLNRFATGCS